MITEIRHVDLATTAQREREREREREQSIIGRTLITRYKVDLEHQLDTAHS